MAGYLQPTDVDVDSFINLVGIDRAEAIARLKGNNNNVEQAVNEFLDDPVGSSNKYRWVDSQFSSDRDGGFIQHDIAFNIRGPDVPGPYEVREPQTRAPSRTSNNRSPQRKVIDLSAEHAAADPSTSMIHDDRELERAIAQSRAEAGLPPQESGTMGTDEIYFGPANRSQYEQDPEPTERKRDLNVPAFLKPSIENHRLGALLTIYHEIPLLREIFLNRLDVQQNYGYDNDWWTGRAIEVPTITGSELDEGQELTHEIQRLMAFLDKTDRSYGSADALANLRAVKKLQRRNNNMDIEAIVLNAWKKVFENRETGQVNKLFSVGVNGEKSDDVTDFAILDLSLPSKSSGHETLYEIADAALWPYTEPETEISSCAYLEHIADVIAFRLDGDEGSSNIEVPTVWYPDRYLKSGRQAALDMRLQKCEIEEDLIRIRNLENGLTSVPIRGGKVVKVQDLFKAALQHELDEINDDAGLGQGSESSNEGGTSSSHPSKAAKLSAQLRKVVTSIDQKLLALNEEEVKARAALRELSKLYTEASNVPTQPPNHRYSLRGISTTKSTTYIRRQAEIDLMDMGLENDASTSNGDQWWRIHYATSGSNPVNVEKVSEEMALEAARTESKQIILVYASDKAMQFEPKPLPAALETFVRNDNALFRAEFNDEDAQSQVTSPGKRKFDDRSEDSQEPGRRNGGTSPKGFESSVQVMERELKTPDDSELEGARGVSRSLTNHLDDRSVTPNGNDEHEIIDGLDPRTAFTDKNTPFSAPEMQERHSMRLLSNRLKADAEHVSTIDSMDLDHVMDDENVSEESAAVRHIGFME